MTKTIEGLAYQLHDLWIEENMADGALAKGGDPCTILREAKQFNLAVAKAIGHDSPLFNDNGAEFLGAYMTSKLLRGSGSVRELAERMTHAGIVLSEEAEFQTGPIAETLNRAANLPHPALLSALESIGFISMLCHPVSMANGKIRVRG